jgi:hypothetical protein
MKEDERAATICGARALESVATRAPRLSARGANANANARASDGVGVGGVDRPRPATGKNEEDAAVAEEEEEEEEEDDARLRDAGDAGDGARGTTDGALARRPRRASVFEAMDALNGSARAIIAPSRVSATSRSAAVDVYVCAQRARSPESWLLATWLPGRPCPRPA